MTTRIVILLAFFALIVSCKNDKEAKKEEVKVEGTKNTLPALGQDVYTKMINECTFIDYIWHELPFSVSQSEKSAVQANVAFISSKGVDVFPKHCKSIGRKSYQINGEIYLDADVYFGPGCSYYIFLKDEKPIYANQMTEEGIKFYTQLFKRALEQGQKIFDANNGGQ